MCKYFGNVAIETIYKASEVLLQYSDSSWYNLDHFTCFIGFIHGDDGDGDANALIPLHFNSSWPLFVQYNRLHAICRCTIVYAKIHVTWRPQFTASVWTTCMSFYGKTSLWAINHVYHSLRKFLWVSRISFKWVGEKRLSPHVSFSRTTQHGHA